MLLVAAECEDSEFALFSIDYCAASLQQPLRHAIHLGIGI